MSQKFGIVVDDSLAKKIESPLRYGDSRSERVRTLIRLGLAVEESATDIDGVSKEIESADLLKGRP